MASMKGIDYLLGTIHSFKGAEFEVCRIFTDVWDDVYYRRNTKKKRKLLNVCLSRCTKKVIVDGDVGNVHLTSLQCGQKRFDDRRDDRRVDFFLVVFVAF